MDGRWVLLTLVVAAAAAIRLRRRAPDESDTPSQPAAGTATEPRRSADLVSPAAPERPARSDAGEGRDAIEADLDGDLDSDRDGDLNADLDEASFDIESVGAALERVWAEHAHDADTILDSRLRQLIDRKVPVRGIRRAPGERAVRVAFADGTVLLCRGSGQGDFGRLGMALHRRSVRLATFAHVEDVTRLEFAWNPDQRLAAVAVGLDQPD